MHSFFKILPQHLYGADVWTDRSSTIFFFFIHTDVNFSGVLVISMTIQYVSTPCGCKTHHALETILCVCVDMLCWVFTKHGTWHIMTKYLGLRPEGIASERLWFVQMQFSDASNSFVFHVFHSQPSLKGGVSVI